MEEWIFYLLIAAFGIISSAYKEWNKGQQNRKTKAPQGQNTARQRAEELLKEAREMAQRNQEQARNAWPTASEASLETPWSEAYEGFEQSTTGQTIQPAKVDPIPNNEEKSEESGINFNAEEARKAIIYQAIMERPYA